MGRRRRYQRCASICPALDSIENVVAVLLAVSITISATTASAQPPTDPAQNAADPCHTLVLKNGNVLSGKVIQNGTSWEVSTPGATLHVPDTNVTLVALSLQDAYEKQRAMLTRPTAGQHLQLAKWCLRQHLFAQAAQELATARALDRHHPGLELVERRLALLRASRPEPRTDAQEVAATQPQVTDENARDEVILAAVQSLVDTLPDGTLEQFNRRVQPVLVNNCTAAGCHCEQGPTKLQLSRALLYEEGNRSTTLRNLAATFAHIDRDNPRQSPLLTIPLRSHGGLDDAVFPVHRRELHDQIQDWVLLVVGEKQAPPPRRAVTSNATTLPYPIASPVQRAAMRTRRPRNIRSRNIQYGARLRDSNPPPDFSLPNPTESHVTTD